MVESSSQNPSSPEITPKEEYVTLDKPESPNPFLPATQVEFTFDEIAFTTNDEVALEAFTRAPSQYKEYLSEFWYTKKTLADSKVWVSTPMGGIRGEIGGKTGGLDQISNKDANILYCLANGVQVFSVQNWTLKPNQPEEPSFTSHMKAICNLDVPVDSKAPEPSSQTKEVPQVKNPGAKNTQSSSTKDKSPSHPSSPTPVVDEMHKEAHFFHFHFESASGYDASADFTAEADSGIFPPNDFIPLQKGMDEGINEESRVDEISKKMKLEDLSDL
ncbi:hypothetical protein Tco_1312968 [Tanacetum coccineum]